MDAPAALRQIREYDPAIRIMWDVERQAVTVWRQPRKGEMPVLVADSPYGQVIDQRLYWWLTNSDTQRYRDLNEYITETVDKPNEAKQEAKAQAAFNSVDYDKMYWCAKHEKTKLDGKPRALFSAVPEKVEKCS